MTMAIARSEPFIVSTRVTVNSQWPDIVWLSSCWPLEQTWQIHQTWRSQWSLTRADKTCIDINDGSQATQSESQLEFYIKQCRRSRSFHCFIIIPEVLVPDEKQPHEQTHDNKEDEKQTHEQTRNNKEDNGPWMTTGLRIMWKREFSEL